jgi:hypothetical protein
MFSVYLVTGTKNPDISQEGTSRISKKIFFITTRGTLKDGQTQFCGLFLWTHIVSQVAVYVHAGKNALIPERLYSLVSRLFRWDVKVFNSVVLDDPRKTVYKKVNRGSRGN